MTTQKRHGIRRRRTSSGPKRSKAKKPVKKSHPARLVITNGCFSGLVINLDKQKTSLGRDISCDICLDHAFVSDEHALIIREKGKYILEDLNSRHGTILDGKEIHRTGLKNGDTISIGDFDLKFTC